MDIREHGADKDGEPQVMDRRLFVQLLVFQCPGDVDAKDAVETVGRLCQAANVPVVVYEDANDPKGIGILTFSEDPDHFVANLRPVLNASELSYLTLRPEFTMLGRTYSGGYEQDLAFWIIDRPKQTALNPEWNWAIWYPLRRTGAFAQLEGREQAKILKEHAIIGRTYGSRGLAHDIRLACHGIDTNDNEFVIGLVGERLHRLSHVIQSMRKTKQTSEYIEKMGPFFVGRAVFRYSGP